MATGLAWNTTNPAKPWALFDRNAVIDIPVDITDWLTTLDSAYGSHTVNASAPLQCDATSHSAGVITARISVIDPNAATVGDKVPFTIRLVCADGQQDDMTLWLKMADR